MPQEIKFGHKPRLLLIGFDGATLDLIQPWVNAGALPNFSRLMVNGMYGPLESIIPPVTPAAWSSMATGLNPGKHGVFDFFARRPDSYETYVVNAHDRRGATLWGLLSRAGLRVSVFNVPATYPPDPVNGLMVSGLLTPTHATDASCPPDLLRELERAVPGFGFYPPGIFSKGEEVQFVQSVLEWDKMTLQATEFLLGRAPWDFFFAVFSGVDIMSHFMWKYMVEGPRSVPSENPTVRDQLANAIFSIYKQADDILGRLTEAAGEQAHVMVVSDHGFGPLESYMHVNAWLVRHGYLKFKRTPRVQSKYLLYRLGFTPVNILDTLRKLNFGGAVQKTASQHNSFLKNMVKRIFLSQEDIDWTRTTVYTRGYAGPLFVNLKGREPHGIVSPGQECETLLERVKTDLRALEHPVTGKPFISGFLRRQDVYTGPYAKFSADLGFIPDDPRNEPYGIHDFASNRWLEPTRDRTGTHRMNGIFFLTGPGVKPGTQVESARLIDVAPTVLRLMGVPIPPSMDGRALASTVDASFGMTPIWASTEEQEQAEAAVAGPALTDEEETIIRKRLEALGYV